MPTTSPVRVSVVAADHPRHPEVRQLRQLRRAGRVLRDQHVRRLHVAVHDPVGVGVGERIAHHDRDLRDVVVRQPPGVKHVPERLASDEL